jgi:hypothetical protein
MILRPWDFYLQANFIEALLDDRYYRPVPWLDYTIGFLVLAAVDLILLIDHESFLKSILLIGMLTLGVLLLLDVLVVHGKWYVNPFPVTITALAIKVSHGLYGYVHEGVKKKARPRQPAVRKARVAGRR